MQYDFIAIGDMVTDAFIRLKNPAAHIDIDKDVREICMRFADKIPYEEVYVIPAVGNSANAAVSAARLGLKSAYVSNIGDDNFGKECMATFKKEKIGTEFIKINKGKKTNYHFVLWFDDDRTILVKHHSYKYELPDIGEPRWIYFSSIGEEAVDFHDTIVSYLDKHPKIKLAFQPGTFQIKIGSDRLKKVYARSELFFCNKEESQRILNSKENDIKKLLKGVNHLGPKITVITDGKEGAYVYDEYEDKYWSMPIYPDPAPPYERTGAGDSFSSTFTVALGLGLPVKEALKWGPINSMSVVQKVGAREGLLTRRELEQFLRDAPKDYFPKEI